MRSPSSAPGLRRSELARKLIHVAAGLGAFAVVLLGPVRTAALTAGLVVFNLAILPRLGGRWLWRSDEIRRGLSIGMAWYPIVLFGLNLVFWQRPEIVAAVWAILALGDGAATVVGLALGRSRLPWNPAKSWAGALAFWLCASLGAGGALYWTLTQRGYEPAPGFLRVTAVCIALIAAFVETLPLAVDDNLSVPLCSGGLLWLVLQREGLWLATNTAQRWAVVASTFVAIVGLLGIVAILLRQRTR